MAGEVAVEQRLRRADNHHAGLAKPRELDRGKSSQRKGLGELQLATVGEKGVLIELNDVGKQTSRAGHPAAVRTTLGRRVVVALNEALRRFLPLEGELVLGELGHGGRLLEEEAVDPVQDLAHELVELGTGELPGQELDGGCGVLHLDMRDRLLLRRHRQLIDRHEDLLAADEDVPLRQVPLKSPVLFAAFLTGDLAEDRSKSTGQTADSASTSSLRNHHQRHHSPQTRPTQKTCSQIPRRSPLC